MEYNSQYHLGDRVSLKKKPSIDSFWKYQEGTIIKVLEVL